MGQMLRVVGVLAGGVVVAVHLLWVVAWCQWRWVAWWRFVAAGLPIQSLVFIAMPRRSWCGGWRPTPRSDGPGEPARSTPAHPWATQSLGTLSGRSS